LGVLTKTQTPNPEQPQTKSRKAANDQAGTHSPTIRQVLVASVNMAAGTDDEIVLQLLARAAAEGCPPSSFSQSQSLKPGSGNPTHSTGFAHSEGSRKSG
jgi:hypothetical protein